MYIYSRDFIAFHNPVHGNCYTFNSGLDNSTKKHISYRVGARHGEHIQFPDLLTMMNSLHKGIS